MNILACIVVAKKENFCKSRAAEKNERNCSASTLHPPLQIKCPFPNKVGIAWDRPIFLVLIAPFFFQSVNNEIKRHPSQMSRLMRIWYIQQMIFQSARLGNSYYLPFQFNVCLNLSPFSFQQFLSIKYTPRFKTFISIKLNFKICIFWNKTPYFPQHCWHLWKRPFDLSELVHCDRPHLTF